MGRTQTCLLTLVLALLGGCGQMGPLYLPPAETPTEAPPDAGTPAPATEAVPAATSIPAS